MKLIIKIDMDNDAFVDDPAYEVKRILWDQVVHQTLDEDTGIILKDINGNSVGAAYTEGE